MKKLLLIFTAFTLTIVTVNAQTATTFSIAGNVGPATTTNYTISFGADLQAAFPVGTGLAITASAGYQNFAYKINFGNTVVKGHQSFIPLLAGIRVPFSSKVYGQGKLGYSLSTTSGGKGAFTYSPGIGFAVSRNVDLFAEYLALSFGNTGSSSGNTLSAVLGGVRINF
jgi:opacity protein-like surface antigen